VKVVIDLLRLKDQWNPHLLLEAVGLAWAQHADHCVGLVVHADLAADDTWIGTEAPLPQTIGQDDDVIAAWLPLVTTEVRPSQQRRVAEDAEKTRRRCLGGHLFRLLGRGQVKLRTAGGANALEGFALMLPVEEVAGGNHVSASLDLRPNHHELIGLRVWHGCQQGGIDHAENRRIGTNSQGQGQHRHRGEALILRQQPQAETDVAPECVHMFLIRTTGPLVRDDYWTDRKDRAICSDTKSLDVVWDPR